MCLIALAIGAHERWPLVIAANRDEAYARPTQPLGWWATDTGLEILGGRDLRDGGVWMAQNRSGRLAMLTNVRQGLPGRGQRSRGELGLAWLSGLSLGEFMAQHSATDYGGCNLTLLDVQAQQWWWLSNRSSQGQACMEWSVQAIAPGLHTISNAQWNTPWPKSRQLLAGLQAALTQAQSREHMVELLLDELAQKERPLGPLPDTGVGIEAETALAPVFIHWPAHDYGTRTSTVLMADQVADDQYIRWIERRFDAQGRVIGDTLIDLPTS